MRNWELNFKECGRDILWKENVAKSLVYSIQENVANWNRGVHCNCGLKFKLLSLCNSFLVTFIITIVYLHSSGGVWCVSGSIRISWYGLVHCDFIEQFWIDLFLTLNYVEFGMQYGWRCRAKLAVRGSSVNPLIGLYEEGTHNVVDIPQCKG